VCVVCNCSGRRAADTRTGHNTVDGGNIRTHVRFMGISDYTVDVGISGRGASVADGASDGQGTGAGTDVPERRLGSINESTSRSCGLLSGWATIREQ
jgi:hypothetical protein